MNPKTLNIIRWVLLGIFCAFMLMDAIGGFMQVPEGVEGTLRLGFPLYFMTIVSIAKVCGVAAMLQPWSPALREWGYAGFTINFVGAVFVHIFMHDDIGMTLMPLVPLAWLMIVYYLGRRRGGPYVA